MNPSAATSPELWRGSDDRQQALFDAATSARETPPDLQRAMVNAMLHAKSDAVAEAAGRTFGTEAAFAVLDWFDSSDSLAPSSVPARWRKVLALQPGSMVDWLASRPAAREASAALIAVLSNPHSPEIGRRGPGPWLSCLKCPEGLDSVGIRLRAYLLALGFDNTGPGSDELVVNSFAAVHEALATEHLPYDSWSLLEDHVPRLSWHRNWDRCERLRRGLVEKFAYYSWPAAQFVRCATDEDMLQAMLESCWKAEGGKRFLGNLKVAFSLGQLLRLDFGQERLLKRFFY
jgi:hypothetical protein